MSLKIIDYVLTHSYSWNEALNCLKLINLRINSDLSLILWLCLHTSLFMWKEIYLKPEVESQRLPTSNANKWALSVYSFNSVVQSKFLFFCKIALKRIWIFLLTLSLFSLLLTFPVNKLLFNVLKSLNIYPVKFTLTTFISQKLTKLRHLLTRQLSTMKTS